VGHIHPELAALSLFSSPAVINAAGKGARTSGSMNDSFGEAEPDQDKEGVGNDGVGLRVPRIDAKKPNGQRPFEARKSIVEPNSARKSIAQRDFSFYSLPRRSQGAGRPSTAQAPPKTTTRKHKRNKYYDLWFWGNQDDAVVEDEVKTFKVGDFVEARYRGYGAYLNGKVVAVWPNGTYHIQYSGSDKEETSVPPDLIRRRRMNAKTKLVGHMLMSLMGKAQTKDSQIAPGDVVSAHKMLTVNEDSGSEDGSEGENEGRKHRQLDISDASTCSSVRSLPPRAPAAIAMQAAAFTVSRLQLTSAGKLHPASKNAPNALEKSAAQKRDEELVERTRLWEELKRVVRMNRCELDINDLMVQDIIGNGKFAAVHKGRYYIYHTNVDLSDVHDPPPSSLLLAPSSVSGTQQAIRAKKKGGQDEEEEAMRAIMPLDPFEVLVAIKTPRYVGAPVLPSTYKSQARLSQEGASLAAGIPKEALEQREDPNLLPPSRIILEYLREIKVLSALRHENIMNAYGMVLWPRLAVVMPLMHGLNLAQHMATEEWQVGLCVCMH
jgi:hypothetical protein